MWYLRVSHYPDREDTMAWNETTRGRHGRRSGRYGSDLTDGEWAVTGPPLPPPSGPGRRTTTDLPEASDAARYMPATGCQWRAIPKCFPPFTTVQNHFHAWRDNGVSGRMLDAPRALARAQAGRDAQPTAAATGSQSVKTTEMGGPSGYDAGRKARGSRRHLAVDAGGFPIAVRVHGADVRDRDGAPAVILAMPGRRRG